MVLLRIGGHRNSLTAFEIPHNSNSIQNQFWAVNHGASSGTVRVKGFENREICYDSLACRGCSLYFQSSALPTELPGHTGWKRVLNRRAGFESSLKRVLEQIL